MTPILLLIKSVIINQQKRICLTTIMMIPMAEVTVGCKTAICRKAKVPTSQVGTGLFNCSLRVEADCQY